MTKNHKNRRVVLTGSLQGVPRPSDFRVVEAAVPEPLDGELLVRHLYISLDPYERSVIAGRHGGGRRALGAGDMPAAETVGRVLNSRHPSFRQGDLVRHMGGWQELSIAKGADAFTVDDRRAPASAYLGVLGMPGLTAYASVVRLANVRAGQRVLVSAALGPVGSMVGQLARERGAAVIGIAGSDEKCSIVVEELHFSSCINYKRVDFRQALRAAIGHGVDVYHDNVGGQLLLDGMETLKPYGQVILCGLMAQYNQADEERHFNFDIGLPIGKRAVMRGLVVYDFESERETFIDDAAPLVRSGRIRYREDRAIGIESTGAHFARLMRGENIGKTLVVLGDV